MIYIGNNNIAQQVNSIFIGDENNKAQEVYYVYIGDINNKSQQSYIKYRTPVDFPQYTSNNSQLTADSAYNSTTRGIWRAFDKDTTGLWWASSNTAFPHWIQYDFGFLVVPEYFQYWASEEQPNKAKDYDFLASVDGINFDTLVSGTLTNTTSEQKVMISTQNSYQYFRLKINSGYTSGNKYGQVAEWNVHGYKK